MMHNLNTDCELRVVDIHKVSVFLHYLLSLRKDFLVLELAVISAFEVQCPTLYLRIVSRLKHVVDLV